MKKGIHIALALVLLLTLGIMSIAAKPIDDGTGQYKGNQAPSGPHYNMNIIGIPKGVEYDKDLNSNFTGGNGARIFVSRKGSTKFFVAGRDEPFQILDHNGTDGSVGTGPHHMDPSYEPGIILPYSGGAYQCEIYVRLVGPKTSECHWKSEWWDGSEWVLIGEFDLDRDETKFQCQTSQLLDDRYQDVLWTLDGKTKFRNCQFRIYVND